jgi:hypothetical protein
MLQQQQNMRSLAAAQRCERSNLLRSIWPSLRQHSNTSSGSNGPAAVAAARGTAAATINQSDAQQHVPHVSVLLQEVLRNLNHMPIKVRTPSPPDTAAAAVSTGINSCDHNSTYSIACAAAFRVGILQACFRVAAAGRVLQHQGRSHQHMIAHN